jgi:hypothetical protein
VPELCWCCAGAVLDVRSRAEGVCGLARGGGGAQAQEKEVRKFLEQGAYDFSFSDNAVPSAETGETMVHMMHKARPQMLDTAGALARLAARKARAERPRHLQGRPQLHLWGLQDHVVHVDSAVKDVGVLRLNEVRVDPLQDVIAQAHYTLQ